MGLQTVFAITHPDQSKTKDGSSASTVLEMLTPTKGDLTGGGSMFKILFGEKVGTHVGLGLRLLKGHYVTPRKIGNFIQCLMHPFLGNVVSSGIPPVLVVDPAGSCNLSCFACPVGNTPPVPRNEMALEDFKKLVDETASQALMIFLYVIGEPFINRELTGMISYAHSKRLYTVVSTNGHFLGSSDKAERLIGSGLDELIITISGITQETYAKYHRNGKIDLVLTGIGNVAAAKERLEASNPKVTVRYIKFAYNSDEIPAARARTLELGADVFSARLGRVSAQEDIMPEGLKDVYLKYKEEYIVSQEQQDGKRRRCLWPWMIGVVNWDGSVPICTQYPWIKDEKEANCLGNVFKEGGFRAVWQGRRAQAFRRKVLKAKTLPEFCRTCTRDVGFGDET
jgi:MoaA/NifB/PqqE/SkfB family radical SAM enzyme